MNGIPDRTLFVIPDDPHRFQTIDNAICKGGTNVFNPTWGTSPLIRGMFPDREHLAAAQPVPVGRVDAFAKIAFVRLRSETQADAIDE